MFDIEEDLFEEVRGESETLAGLILELTGEIPQKDQIIKYRKFYFQDRICRQKKDKGDPC